MFHDTLFSKILFQVVTFMPALLLAPAAPAAACDNGKLVPVDTIERSFSAVGETQCFLIAAPEGGLLLAEVIGSIGGPAQPKLGLVAVECHDADCTEGAVRSVAQRPSSLLLEIPGAGRYSVRVAAQDSTTALGDYRLSTRLWPRGLGPGDKSNEPNPEDIEVDVELFTTGTFPAGEENESNEPNPEDIEVDVELFTTGSPLCPTVGGDDHADTFPCAARILPARWTSGRLENGWGDDVDTVSFDLHRQRTVTLVVDADAPMAVELFDPSGQRLTADETADGSTRMQWEKTLGAGQYFVRIAALDGEGANFKVTYREKPW